MTNEVLTSGEGQLLNLKLENVKEANARIESAIVKIGDNLQALVRLEERQVKHGEAIARSFVEIGVERERINVLDEDVDEIERVMLALRETRNWVIGGVSAVVLSFIAALFSGGVVIQLAR